MDGFHLELVRHIPVHLICASMQLRSEEWPWRSHRATAAIDPTPPFLMMDWLRFAASDEHQRWGHQRALAGGVDEPRTRPDLPNL